MLRLNLCAGGNKNKLNDENRAKIMEAFTKRADIEYFAKVADNKTIEGKRL